MPCFRDRLAAFYRMPEGWLGGLVAEPGHTAHTAQIPDLGLCCFADCCVVARYMQAVLRRQRKRPKSLIYLGLLDFSAPWRTLYWWSRGELNPRPQAITEQFYMCSRLI